jgi:CubicO group peptidase (beta-lactamase class C family)
MSASTTEPHSFIFLRHGKVIAEGWWKPYAPQLKHSLYSLTKSFTSTAVGFAITEKRLSLNDKVISFFPNSLPDSVSPWLAELTVKDLLTMSVGQAPDPTSVIPATSDNWVKSFLATEIKYEPGKKFLYNSMASFMLSAIVQKVTGQREIEYLRPRLFEPLGIEHMDWESGPNGTNTGGWGLRLKTEDIAKFAELYLQNGMWNGKQLVPKEWVQEATTFKIDQAPDSAQSKKDSSDWMQGYCYQFWRCRHNAFRGDGAFGQFAIVIPGQDAAIAITAETPNMQEEINLVWKYLLPSMHVGVLPANNIGDAALKKDLATLALPPLTSNIIATQRVDGKTFTLKSNPLHWQSFSFSTSGSMCTLSMLTDSGRFNFSLGNGTWQAGESNMAGPYLLARAKEDFSFLKPYKIAGSYAWMDPHTLMVRIRYIESPHTRIITCVFDGDAVKATVENSFSYGKQKITIEGEALK